MGEEKREMSVEEIMEKLAEPFPDHDIEWRMNRTYKKDENTYGGWVVAYVSSRAIMNRLDDVLGVDGWEDEYKPFHTGFSCGIRLWFQENKSRIKWDGADPTKYEATKGGFSSAFKRAAVKWGVGRYLYEVPEQHVEIYKDRNKGFHYFKDQNTKFVGYWNSPKLPKKYQPSTLPVTQEPMVNMSKNNLYQNPSNNSNNQLNQGEVNRDELLNWIEETEDMIGISKQQAYTTRIFSTANPQRGPVIERAYIFTDATIDELKDYIDALKPIRDIVKIANHYDCSKEEMLQFAQIVKADVQVNGLMSLFFKLGKEDVNQIKNIAMQHKNNNQHQTA